MADKRSVNLELSANPAALKAGLEESRKQFLTTFGEAKAAVDKTSASLEAAQAKAQAMAKSLGDFGPPTRKMVEDFNAARAAVNAAEAAVQKQTTALQRSRQAIRETTEALAAQARAERDSALATQQRATLAAVAAKNSGIASSLGTFGLRTGADIRQEIADANRAIQSLKATGAAAEDIRRASAAAQAKIAALNAELRGAASASQSAGQSLASSAHHMAAIAAAALTAKQAIDILRDSVKTGVQFDSLKTQFAFANGGDVRKAADEMAFASQLASRLGLELVGTTKDYGKLQAAAKGTTLEGKATRDIFQAVASAGAVMGLTAEEQSGVLLALSQMMSKGTVQSEELRGQLGERLPGAFQLAAKAMNVTTEELGKMLEAGQVTAEQFLPRFAAALQASVNGALPAAEISARAQLQRLENAFTEFKLRIAQSGLLDKMAEQIERVMARISEMADSGELQRLASQFADAFGKGIQFLADATLFAERFSGALVPLAEALTAVMVGGRLLALAAPSTASGIAASGAAAGVAAGGFRLLAGALRLVPQLALGASIIWAAEKLIEWGAKASETRSKAAALEGEIQNLINANSEHASAAMRDAEGIKEFGDEALAAYEKAIKGARDYAAAKVADLSRSNKNGRFDSEIAFYRQQAETYNRYIDTVLAGEKLRREQAQLTGKIQHLEADREKLMNGDLTKSKKEMLDEQIKGYEKLIDAIRTARDQSKKEAEDARKSAAAHREKASDLKLSASDKAQALREQDLTPEEKRAADQARADEAQSKGSYAAARAALAQIEGRGKDFEKYSKEAEKFLERALQFAEKAENADQVAAIGDAQSALENARAKADDQAAKVAEEQAAKLMDRLNEAEAKLKQLKGEEASIKVNADITAAINQLAQVEAKLADLDGKVATVTVATQSQGGVATPTPGFAAGGWTGPGSKYQPAGIVHADEFVTRQEIVRQPGALAFLSTFNRVGMAALRGYATGGLVSRLSIPSLPSMASPGSSGRPVIFQMPDGSRYPMRGNDDVVDRLTNALGREALRRGGRK